MKNLHDNLRNYLYGVQPERVVRNRHRVPHSNRLEDRIRRLSDKLVDAKGEEFHRLSVELRTAITST
jgi:hypothetical protein